MKSITIHKLDEALARVLTEKARKEGLSISELVKRLLRAALGLSESIGASRWIEFCDT
jgi:hypothetical protein